MTYDPTAFKLEADPVLPVLSRSEGLRHGRPEIFDLPLFLAVLEFMNPAGNNLSSFAGG